MVFFWPWKNGTQALKAILNVKFLFVVLRFKQSDCLAALLCTMPLLLEKHKLDAFKFIDVTSRYASVLYILFKANAWKQDFHNSCNNCTGMDQLINLCHELSGKSEVSVSCNIEYYCLQFLICAFTKLLTAHWSG